MKRRANRLSRISRRRNRKKERREAKIEFLKSLSPEDYAEHIARKNTKIEKMGRGTNVHHRKTRWLGGSNDKSNLSVVSVREHNAFNLMFNDGHMHPTEIARKLSEVWIDPSWIISATRRDEPCLSTNDQQLTLFCDAPNANEFIATASGSSHQPSCCSTCEKALLFRTLQPVISAFALSH